MMHPDPGTSAHLASFDPALAEAVVAVLRREGVSAVAEPDGNGQVEVRVPAAHREQALTVLAARMEAVHELARSGTAAGAAPAASAAPDEDDGPPIVMERFRRMGFGIAVVLAPLLIVTLGGALPLGYAVGLFVLGLVAVVYWRRRSEDDEQRD